MSDIEFIYRDLAKKKLWGLDYFDELMGYFEKAGSLKRRIIMIVEIEDEKPNEQ